MQFNNSFHFNDLIKKNNVVFSKNIFDNRDEMIIYCGRQPKKIILCL